MLRRVVQGTLLGMFLASVGAVGPANAVEPSGTAIRVDPAVNASGAEGRRLLELEGAVFIGDEIVAGPRGLAQIKFIDDTRIVVGPNSRLKIDTFVFNPNNTAKKVTISAIRGTFRFISGRSAHEAYSIRTPTMTIGVRGTVLDINVNSQDSSVMFLSGSGSACDAGGQCMTITNTCEIWIAPRGGSMGRASGVDRRRRLSVNFPFLNDQSRLASDFQFRSNCDVADPRFLGTPRETQTEGGSGSGSHTSTSSPTSPSGGGGAPSGGGGGEPGGGGGEPGGGGGGEPGGGGGEPGGGGEGGGGEGGGGEGGGGEGGGGEGGGGEGGSGEGGGGEGGGGEGGGGGAEGGATQG